MAAHLHPSTTPTHTHTRAHTLPPTRRQLQMGLGQVPPIDDDSGGPDSLFNLRHISGSKRTLARVADAPALGEREMEALEAEGSSGDEVRARGVGWRRWRGGVLHRAARSTHRPLFGARLIQAHLLPQPPLWRMFEFKLTCYQCLNHAHLLPPPLLGARLNQAYLLPLPPCCHMPELKLTLLFN